MGEVTIQWMEAMKTNSHAATLALQNRRSTCQQQKVVFVNTDHDEEATQTVTHGPLYCEVSQLHIFILCGMPYQLESDRG